MKRRTQTLLYHLLPVVYWLLAISGIAIWEVFNVEFSLLNYLPALLALLSGMIIRRIRRHESSVEQCLEVGILIGIAACWMPSVIFLILPVWGYLIYKNLFGMRSFCATLIGLAVVAIWAAVLSFFQILTFNFLLSANLFAWVQTGAIVTAWLASTITRQILRVR